MSTMDSPDEGHVVHLLQRWDDVRAPESLRIKPRLSPAIRLLLAALLAVASSLAGYFILMLWVLETPGWWFSLLFTVMIGGLTLGLWAGYLGALRSGVRREQASARWQEIAPAVRFVPGVITSRNVITGDDGSVPRFELTVRTESGTVVSGTWRPRAARYLLQPQVPGVGTSVRVWSVAPQTGVEPLVIEVLDPTVVSPGDKGGVNKYVD